MARCSCPWDCTHAWCGCFVHPQPRFAAGGIIPTPEGGVPVLVGAEGCEYLVPLRPRE